MSVATRTDVAYQAVARELREGILREEFADGRRLPTEAQLVAAHGVSRQTVRRAFQDLVAEGMVYRIRGRGTFATPAEGRYLRQFGSVDDLMSLSVDTEFELVEPLHPRRDPDAAAVLHVDGDDVPTVVFLRLHDGAPFCVTTVHLPPRVAEALAAVPELTEPARRSRVTVIGLIDAHLADPVAEADQRITVALAGPDAAAALGCPEGEPVLHVERLYLDTAGDPVELAVSDFLPRSYTYRVHLRRSAR